MIGGEHFLRVPSQVENSLGEQLVRELGNIAFFATGRDALATLLASLPELTVHLPDLICSSIHDACRAAGKAREIYRIGTDFVNFSDLEVTRRVPTIVFVMHYFGVCNDSLIQHAKDAGLTVISDVTHLLFDINGLTKIARDSDFLIASLRKSGPFPDCGFVSSLKHRPVEPGRGMREEFFTLRAAGLLSRGFSALENFANDENFHLLKKAEGLLEASEPADYACSHLSRQLALTISVPASVTAIRRNVAILADGMRRHCIVPRVENLLTPYFPCIFDSSEQRDSVRSVLASNSYFFPIHWPTLGLPVPSLLSNLILSIPCDARYDERVMQSILEIIDSCLPQ